jgi:tetratricopeptide (TPR) repeat protein
VFWRMQRLPEAIKEYENVVALRPRDYVPWLDLGSARAKDGDEAGALTAFREAVLLAPYYGQPRWELGRLLLRIGHRDDAFAELRQAAISDRSRLQDVIDLAWETYRGDSRAVQQAVLPETAQARLTLARFFVEHGKATEAIDLYRGGSGDSREDRRPLLNALLTAMRFKEAHEVWASDREVGSGQGHQQIATITDGSFENNISLDDPGFGWQLANDLRTVRIALDTNGPHSGMYSLCLTWNGDSDPSLPVISQLVLVEPKTRYRLVFAARSQDLLTIGLPFVAVIDASDKENRVLTQSKAFPGGTTGWQDYPTEFTTAEHTDAVLIRLRRETCATPQCAILGTLWLDDFVLKLL